MDQFNVLVSRAKDTSDPQAGPIQYLSCNFTDLRTGNLMLDPYALRTYKTSAGPKRVAFVGICTPESLTKSSPAHFQDQSGTYIYGFCEDDEGSKLYAAVQSAVDAARNAGADYVVALGHLGRSGVTPRWSSSSVVANTSGIDVMIDGHSHEEYVDTLRNKDGSPVLVTQTGTQLESIGQITIDPAANRIAASAGACSGELVTAWDGIDAATAAVVSAKKAQIEKITGQKVGYSDVRLIATESDNYTWAVRQRETNLGDFVADAYLALAWHGGIMADVALVNGGGIRANIEPGTVTYGDVINVQPYSNQLCYIETKGQNILDALEMGASKLPEGNGGFMQTAGVTYAVRTDVPSSIEIDDKGNFVRVAGEYRVRDVLVDGRPLDTEKTYKMVSHTYLIMDGGDGMGMFKGDDPVLLDLDNAALIEYLTYDLKGVIGSEYASEGGQGRIAIKNGPDPDPAPEPGPEPQPEPVPTPAPTTKPDPKPLARTGDPAEAAIIGAAVTAVAAGAVAASVHTLQDKHQEA